MMYAMCVSTRDKKGQDKVSVREHFVMTDRDCTVFHFIVEGSAISDVTKIPPEVSRVLCQLLLSVCAVWLKKNCGVFYAESSLAAS